MNCSELPPAGMVLAVASTVPPPRTRRFTIASPIPLVPPVTRIRLPVNSFASYGTLDALIGEPPGFYSCYDWAIGSVVSLIVSIACAERGLWRGRLYSVTRALHGPMPVKRVGVIRVM